MPRHSNQAFSGFAFPSISPPEKIPPPPEHPEPPFTVSSLRGIPTALLLVGEQQTPFHVHQNLLFAVSRFFTANLTTGFAETTTQTVALPEEDVDTVDLFVQWVYHRRRWPLSCLCGDRFMQLACLYSFADRLDIPRLMNDVVWEPFDLRYKDKFPPFSVVAFAYTYIPDHTHFQKLMVAWYTWHDGASVSGRIPTVEELEELPKFTAELATSLMQRLRPGARDPFLDAPDAHYKKVE